MKRFQAARPTSVRIIFAICTLLLVTLGLIPAAALGQEPVGQGGDPTPTPYALFLPLLQTATSTNLLLNPSFEAQPDGLLHWQWLVPEVTYQLHNDPLAARDGERYLAANRQDSSFGNKSLYQDIGQPQAGATYHFAIWVRASQAALDVAAPRTGRVALWAHGGSPAWEHSTWNFQLNDTHWHCAETSLTVNQAGHANLRAEIYLTSLDNLDYYIDHAILRDDGQPACATPPANDGSTLVSQGQGFDTCAAPTTSQLAAWKQASPFDYLGIYLGGANHYAPCKTHNQHFQTAAWFSTVLQQGWQFIPIWVGPQAPCSAYSTRISSDLDTARVQGKNEAQQALGAAATLGLTRASKPYTIIYYDIEAYNVNNIACHNAVNAFLNGWVNELQKQGHKAGIYGSVLAVNDWYTLQHVPDSVWVARYIGTTYDPNMTVSVVNQGWIVESYWDNHRLFQYSGSHNEQYGGVTLNIDNDTASGLVALESPGRPLLQKMDLLTSDQGWVWLGQQLFQTTTGGDQWTNITPPDLAPIRDVFFLDRSHGWVISTTEQDSIFQISLTTDGGQSWQTRPFSALGDTALPLSAAYLDFITPQTGWLVLKIGTSVNASQGLLFKTTDGGLTWTRLTIPLGEPVRFVDETFGWTAGGPLKSELFVTRDGGQSWQAQTIVPAAQGVGQPVYRLPLFDTGQQGGIAVSRSDGAATRLEFYTTGDGGFSWQLSDSLTLPKAWAPGTAPPLHILDSQHWLVADAEANPSTPDNLIGLDLTAPETGWGHIRDKDCADHCQIQDRLLRTVDGGQTWLELKLP